MQKSKIIEALIDFAKRIGRWIIRKWVAEGIDRLIGFLRRRARNMRQASVRAHDPRIKRWQARRARLREDIANWLDTHKASIIEAGEHEVCDLAHYADIPEYNDKDLVCAA